MMVFRTTIKSVLIVFGLLVACLHAIAQPAQQNSITGNTAPSPQNVASPNAASLGMYGDVPVSLYTGLPSIGVPLYSLAVAGHTLPIALSYHASGFRPDEHPGWVGRGWNLSTGGAITRVVKDLPDEYSNKYYSSGANEKIFIRSGYYYRYSMLSGGSVTPANGGAPRNLNYDDKEYMTAVASLQSLFSDTEPDEFSFNFAGYSGKFYLSHTREWKVQCDKAVRVEFTPADTLAIPFALPDTHFLYYANDPYGSYAKSFGKFTLTTEDGTSYVFGGVTNAIEYSINEFSSDNKNDWTADSWYLSKIVYPTKQEVTFSYERDNFISQLYLSIYQVLENRYNGTDFPFSMNGSCGDGTTDINSPVEKSYTGRLVAPVYLASIQSSTISIEFIRSTSRELRYPKEAYDWMWDFASGYQIGSSQTRPSVNGTGRDIWPFLRRQQYLPSPSSTWTPSYPGCLAQLQWKKLDQIRIKDNRGNIQKRIDFTYSDNSNNANRDNERLTLQAVQETGSSGLPKPAFQFVYQDASNLPNYLVNQNDHWGYYNARNMPMVYSGGFLSGLIIDYANYYASRNAAATSTDYLKGILTKIIYPTGGSTIFDYEQHTYTQQVNVNRSSLPTSVSSTLAGGLPAGGLRIRAIRTYTSTAALPSTLTSTKEYFYVKGYTAGADPAQLTGSGVLGGQILYEYTAYDVDVPNSPNHNTYHKRIFASQSVLPACNNTQGSHIGYSQVVEKRQDGSYSLYYYTNFDNGRVDESATADQTIQPTRTPYEPYASTEQTRGQLQKEESFTNAGACVKRHATYYSALNPSTEYVRALKADFFMICSGTASNTLAIPEATLYKHYTYSYLPIRERETLYTSTGDSLPTVKEYEYNQYRLVVNENAIDSKGQVLRTLTKYADDITTFGSSLPSGSISATMKSMRADGCHLTAAPIEKLSYRNGKLIGGTLQTYQAVGAAGAIIQPYQTFALEPVHALDPAIYAEQYSPANFNTAAPGLDSKLQLQVTGNTYDNTGNLLNSIGQGNQLSSYLWGYNNTLLIAKADNALPSEFFHSNFEENLGWDTSLTYDTQWAHTGTSAGMLASYNKGNQNHSFSTIPVTIPTTNTKKFVLSGWVYSEGPTAQLWLFMYQPGQSNYTYSQFDYIATAPADINKWVYLQKEILVPANSNITTLSCRLTSFWADANAKGGRVWFDDIRIHPADAQMTTYTHQPGIGVTSISDANNKPTISEYDGLQRLSLLRDQDGNVVKQYQYHYKNQ